MDGASLMDSAMEFQMLGDDRKRADRLWDWYKAELREVDYWITMSEKVAKERLVHEGMLDGQKTEYCK